jgi:hypothetical protein
MTMVFRDESVAYYSTPGLITDPGEYAYCLDGLPRDLPELSQVVRGLVVPLPLGCARWL